MKEIRPLLLICLVTFSTWIPVSSQVQNCYNLGFEQGNFTNWEGTTWNFSTENPEMTTPPVDGILDRRHTIISDDESYDPATGYGLKMIPPGYEYSCRLGDIIYDRSIDPLYTRAWHQNIRYTLDVDANNAFLVLKFALVLEYASDHTVIEEPRFRFTLYDEFGDTIPDCANYDVYASNDNVEGFNLYDRSGDLIMWRDWTTVGVNLTNYIGSTITIEFLTSDCTQTHHFGYGYFVASCQPLDITVGYCTADSIAVLTAPEGFEQFTWTNSYRTVIGTSQTLEVVDPVEGSVFTCTMISATGCEVSISSEIARYSPVADFGSYMIDCINNEVQFTDSSSTNQGNLSYLWDFGDGNTSAEISPQYTFLTSGLHQVELSLFNPPSSCTSILSKVVESFSPPLVGIDGFSTYCPGESVTLRAYGAYDYTWDTGSKEDSIVVSAPGGDFSLIGASSTGCSDTNLITISEEPDWDFFGEGDTILCVGENSILTTSGAFDHLWNTGDISSSLPISLPGTYICIGANQRGCEKTYTFNVERSPTPLADFTLADYTVNARNNTLTGSIPSQTDVQYLWDMGDSRIERGTNIQHTYYISNEKLYYTITLTATNADGCINTASEIIDVTPFIPNVFSPNDDGINDVFMPHLELQIFDRYGVLLYEGTDGWDGRYHGQPSPPDTYFYYIFYSNREDVEHQKKGYLTLVR